jgi:hypothetical protein
MIAIAYGRPYTFVGMDLHWSSDRFGNSKTVNAIVMVNDKLVGFCGYPSTSVITWNDLLSN